MIQRFEEDHRMAQIVVAGGFFETAGQVSLADGIQNQTRQALLQIDTLLAKINADKSNITRMQIWLADMKGDFALMNEIYDAWIKDSPKPARVCVGADFLDGYKIEIQAFGYLGNTK